MYQISDDAESPRKSLHAVVVNVYSFTNARMYMGKYVDLTNSDVQCTNMTDVWTLVRCRHESTVSLNDEDICAL